MNEIVTHPSTLNHATVTLAEVSEELAAWVPILKRLAEAESLRSLAQGQSFEITSAVVRSIIAARRLREEYFWPAMSESAWDLLLELLAVRLDGRRLQIAALTAATDLPAADALHWIDWMMGRGIVTRRDANENSAVDLTDRGADRLRAYLVAALSLSPWTC
jgi:predicted transcriptional regulator